MDVMGQRKRIKLLGTYVDQTEHCSLEELPLINMDAMGQRKGIKLLGTYVDQTEHCSLEGLPLINMDAMGQRKRMKLLGTYVDQTEHCSQEGLCFINKLPDALLVNIISILPLQQAVQTSILSKRWKHLWKSIHNVQLIYTGKLYRKLVNQAACAMEPFFCHYQGPKLQQFNLQFPALHTKGHWLDSWIHFALCHHVEEFWADCSASPCSSFNYKIPSTVFESQWLIELRLINCSVQIPSSVYLPSLKTLVLKNLGTEVSTTDVGFIISKCPSLENLSVLLSCSQGNLRISVGSLRLKTLTVRHQNQIVIDAPNVQSLELQYKLPDATDMGNFSFLTRLCLNLGCYYEGVGDELKKFLVDHHYVRNIKLSEYCIEILSSWTTNMIKMMATCLELVISLTSTAQLGKINTILSFFPGVETLILVFYRADKPLTRQSGWESMKHSFVNALQHIKTIVMHDFISFRSIHQKATLDDIWSSCEMKIELARIVLQKSTCLDKVVITLRRDMEYNEWRGKAQFRLMLMEKLQCSNRASPGAKIFVY